MYLGLPLNKYKLVEATLPLYRAFCMIAPIYFYAFIITEIKLLIPVIS